MGKIRLILTTFSSVDDAATVIRTLVEERLAACGTMIPRARSIYFWEGKIEDGEEVWVMLKTPEEKIKELETRLDELHPYETPEIIVLDPAAVSDDYAAWVMKTCLP